MKMKRVGLMEDLSGISVTPESWRISNELPPTLTTLLKTIVGRYYVPYMLANAKAWDNKSDLVVFTDRDGREWNSTPFKYQQKCVGWLREDYAKLASKERAGFDHFLADTDCAALFSPSSSL